MTSPEWTRTFLSTGVAEKLVAQGDKLVAELNNNIDPPSLQPEQQQQQQQQRRRQLGEQASALYLRACCLYRIARFPYITSFPKVNDQTKWDAWQKQKEVYLKAGKLWEESPLEEVEVPFVKRRQQEQGGEREKEKIPVYVRVPPPAGTSTTIGSASSEASFGPAASAASSAPGRDVNIDGYPTVILMTGLDGYRPDNTVRCNEFLARGWAVVVVEIPGTADCPADPTDPESPDRLWESLLQWMGTYQYRSGKKAFDMKRVMVWGLSAGGYYAVRIAHTHGHRLAGVVAQGAGVHYFYDEKWLEKVDGHEYPAQ